MSLDLLCLVSNQTKNITSTCEKTKIGVFKTAKTEYSHNLNNINSYTWTCRIRQSSIFPNNSTNMFFSDNYTNMDNSHQQGFFMY